MQLMWVSGPTASVRTISITARKALASVGVTSFLLVLLGIVLHMIGFRLAIDVSPALAHNFAGMSGDVDQRRLEDTYRDKLNQLRQSLSSTLQELHQLEATKNRLANLATPASLQAKPATSADPRGGPWIPVGLTQRPAQPLSEELNLALGEFAQTEAVLKQLSRAWRSQVDWLQSLPTGLPVAHDFHVTSGFGVRADPFTGQLAMHEGLDFVAPPGTPVLASASGTVTRSAWEASYGNLVEVSHIEGFTTRYAHLSERLVKEGQPVQRGEAIGKLGGTGRSTGPHLHFEVIRHERAINPMQVLTQTAAR